MALPAWTGQLGGCRNYIYPSMNPFDRRPIGASGLEVDALGFGCATLGNLYRDMTDADARDVLEAGLRHGFRYFDTAPHYGQGLSERRVGDALRRSTTQEYVLSTKVGRLLRPAGYARERHGYVSPMPFDIAYDYGYEGVMRSFEDSLQRLGLDRIDILFMHDIGEYTHGKDNERLFPIAMEEGYQALDELRSGGLVRAIGIGANEFQVCEAALNYGDWDCFLLAGRYTLLEQGAIASFFPACERHSSSVIIGGAYNSGILATGVLESRRVYYDYGPAPREIIDRVAAIERVCRDFSIPLAAAALQFPLAHPAVISVIPGMGRARRIGQTLELFSTDIPEQFWQALLDQSLLDADAPTPLSLEHHPNHADSH